MARAQTCRRFTAAQAVPHRAAAAPGGESAPRAALFITWMHNAARTPIGRSPSSRPAVGRGVARQLARLGLGRGAIARRAQTGPPAPRPPRRLRHRRRRAPPRRPPLAAVLACGPGAVLSHVSAAVHWGLLTYDAPRPDVTAPASGDGRPGDPPAPHSLPRCPGHHHVPRHPDDHGRQTLLDLAATRRHHLEHALGQAMRYELYDHARIDDVLAAPPAAAAPRR